MSFDLDHDGDLRDRLLEESRKAGSSFEISGCSESSGPPERVRRRISEADEVIVICGAHTAESAQVRDEIGLAQEVEKPYFLLWGRREVMCTKPVGARAGDSMYSWTSSIVRDQIALTLRKAQPPVVASAAAQAPAANAVARIAGGAREPR
jgi:hypothetical protein